MKSRARSTVIGQSNGAERPKNIMQMLAECYADVQKAGKLVEVSGKIM